MNWLFLSFISAFALGFYDFFKKLGVDRNCVMPVLFFATLTGTLFLTGIEICSGTFGAHFSCTPMQWILLVLKSWLVSASWIAGYFALHDLPLTIVAPIRASSPVWVFIGGIFIFGQIPTLIQAIGTIIAFLGYFCFCTVGKLEHFSWHDRGVRLAIAATLLGAASGLFDNYLLQTLQIPAPTVQLHFSLNLVWVMGVWWLLQRWIPFLKEDAPFTWRWCIPAIGLFLIVADWAFFHAIACEDAQIGILAVLRRQSVIISFFAAVFYFGEKNIVRKLLALALLMAGVLIIKMG